MGHVPKNSGALRTTPNEALNAILNLPSLDLAGMERASYSTEEHRAVESQFYGYA